MIMIVEQTKKYAYRMEYDPKTKSFHETEYESLMHNRKFVYPYGWVKESRTPPEPHFDCILMSDGNFELGEAVPKYQRRRRVVWKRRSGALLQILTSSRF